MRRTRIARLFSRRFEFALALLESSAGTEQTHVASGSPEKGTRAMLFAGCVGEGLFRRVNDATKRVLGAQAFEVETPKDQVCCGALHAHTGDLEGARRLARRNLAAFAAEADIPIVTNAGGCGAMLKSYGHLLSDDQKFCDEARTFSDRVFDVGQIVSLERAAVTTPDSESIVTYDASCHLMYGQHAAEQSLEMVTSVGDVHFVPLAGAERCCGGAGIYNLLEPELSQEVLSEKIENLRRTGATVLATGNPGCQMQIGAGAKLAGLNIRVCHPVELLDEWFQRSGRYGE